MPNFLKFVVATALGTLDLAHSLEFILLGTVVYRLILLERIYNSYYGNGVPAMFTSNALSFYRSQNVLCPSKFFEPTQKFDWI
jgi:hypothetical protein